MIFVSAQPETLAETEARNPAEALSHWKSAWSIAMGHQERMAQEIARLTAERDAAREALESCASWIDRWTSHVGRCEGGDKCTCGRTAVLAEARDALDQQLTQPREPQNG